LDAVRTRVAGVLLAAGEGSRFGQPKALVELNGQTLAERGVNLLRSGGADPILVVVGAAPVELDGTHTVYNSQWRTGMGSSLRAALQALVGSAATSAAGTAEATTAEPGTAEPGTAEPGTAEPGTAELGTAEPGTAEPGTAEPGTAEPGTAEATTAEPGTAEADSGSDAGVGTGFGSDAGVATGTGFDRDVGAVVVALADQPLVGAEAVARLIAAYRDGATVAVAAYDGQARNPVLLARECWAEVIAMATGDQGARTFLRARPDLITVVECGDTGRPDDIDTPADLARITAAATERT
jgi:CTP:molybdopterin cytidylyltransferase MocA